MPDHASPPEPPIHRAARLGDLDKLERLLALGEDVNSRADLEDDDRPCLGQLTPLMAAARSDDGATAETLRWLLEHGADPHARSECGVTAAWYAAGRGAPREGREQVVTPDRADRLRTLLDAGINPDDGAGSWWSLLAAACRAGDPARVRLLLERGATAVPAVKAERPTPAGEWAASLRDTLVKAGLPEEQIEAQLKLVCPELQGRLSAAEIPLFCAAQSGSAECVRLILAAGADPDVRDDRGHTPLMAAGSAEVVRALTVAGADVHAADDYGGDVLEVILRGWSDGPADPPTIMAVATALATAGADLGRPNKYGWTRLYTAAFNRNEAAVRFLLGQGADPEARLEDGKAALHAVGWSPKPFYEPGADDEPEGRLVALLVEAGADVNARDSHGNTPLHVAVSPSAADSCSSDGSNPAAALALLRHGADPNCCNVDGDSPLTRVVRYGSISHGELECVRILLAAGADLDYRTPEGHTALDYARTHYDYWSKAVQDPPEPDPGLTLAEQEDCHQEALLKAVECVRLLGGKTEGSV